MKRLWTHPWTVAASNLLLMLLSMSLSRLLFYAFNRDLFPGVSASHLCEMLLGGIRFDLTASLYLLSLYLLLMLLPLPVSWRNHPVMAKIRRWAFALPATFALVLNAIDTIYIRFSDRRTTCTVFSEFQNDHNIPSIVLHALGEYWLPNLLAVALIVLLLLAVRHDARSYRPAWGAWGYWIGETAILLVSAYFVVIGIRGGFGSYTRPINNSNALQYTNQPRETAIVLNTAFSIFETIDVETYHEPGYYSLEETEAIMSPIHAAHDSISAPRTDNVVILILESFSKEFIGYYNSDLQQGTYTGYTPFLDSLLAQSITYRCSFASGRKSIDAMPSVLSSIPMLIEPYIVTPYATNAVSSIADCLGQRGYTTAFFHGAPNGSMGFQAYARAAHFGTYYGMNEYDGPEAFDGTWAIWDEPFLLYYARTMNSLPEPFCTAVFTASSHHPFRLPEAYRDTFPQGTQPLHACIGYSDMALRHFFDYARKQSWFDHTLFVLTADHTNQLSLPEYTNAVGLYEVPIAFYHAGMQGELRTEQAISQTDIMPSVLAFLGYDEPFFAFGEDALTAPKKHPWAICYNAPVYQIMSDSLLLQFDGQQACGLYCYREDRTLSTNRIAEIADYPEAETMLRYLRAYILQYIHRMITNQLTCPKYE